MPNNLHTSMRQFHRRQHIAERRYQKRFMAYLRKSYTDVAKEVSKNGFNVNVRELIDDSRLESILRLLYRTLTIQEAKLSYVEFIAPYEEDNRLRKKDIIDDLAGIFSGRGSGLIRMWQSLLDNFLEVRLTNRISQINQTTNERISRIIEDGIFEGMGQEEVARILRKEAGAALNINRSRNIARTETVVAANQGKYLAAKSSNLMMLKKWVPTLDARTRDGGPGREANHRIMEERDWIDLEQDFQVPNSLGINEPAKYPGDPRLSAGNVINCRCSIVFKAKRDSNGSLIRKR